MTVAALYIDPRGPYPSMPDVDCWDAERDARRYAGPHPVVAHPPCGPWGQLAHLCTRQDPGLALAAAAQVMRWGGVLEHPAGSRLWDALRLPKPKPEPDSLWPPNGGWSDRGLLTIEVEQVRWGHRARKRTWLLVSRPDRPEHGFGAILDEAGAMPPREPTHWISGMAQDRRKKAGMLRASSQISRRTPPAFAEWLVSIAERCRRR